MKTISDTVSDQTLCTMGETGTAAEAARRMTEFDVGCVLVVDDDGRLIGVVSERDIARRIVAPELDPNTTTVGQFMSRNPDTLAPGDSPLDALELMWIRKYRHLPVVDGERLVGMVSVRDLYEVMRIGLEQSLGGTEASLFDDLSGA